MTTETTVIRLEGAPAVPGLRARRIRPGDETEYARMAELVAAANRIDEIPWLPTAAHLREDVELSPGSDPARDLLLIEVGDELVAFGGVQRAVRDGRPVYDAWGTVHPDHRRRGIGGALLRHDLGHIRGRAIREDEGQAVVVRAHAEATETGHRALLEQSGFAIVRWFFLMRRGDLADIPAVVLPDGIEIRPVETAHHRAIFEAEAEAFRDHWGHREMTDADFRRTYERAELDTSLWVVGWDGDEVAGVVQNWIWPEENAELGVARGWHERISVRRPWRRRGLARALTAESLHRLRGAGMTDTMLGVDAANQTRALGLYEGLGFEVHQRSMAYERTIGP